MLNMPNPIPRRRIAEPGSAAISPQTLTGLPLRLIQRTVIFGAYDNLIARFGAAGKLLRGLLQFLERTPMKFFGLSHFWVVEKLAPP